MSMITELFGQIPNDIETQMLIAPVLSEMIATQAFAINDQFIVNNTLYKATKAIAIGDTISVGTSTNDNCVLSDSITQQMNKNGTYVQTVSLVKASNGFRWISIFTGIKGTHTLTSVKEIKSGAPELVSNFTAFPTLGGLRAYTSQTTWDGYGLAIEFTIS